ncbi:type IV secretion system DNA-binding domain-containing protein [Vibrio parahaemolyticus]|nr:type IV secretion system DNA-binding domain-containing protein [Vibrio parahaemolyticus]
MNLYNNPPYRRYQDWQLIIISFVVISTALAPALLFLTWSWFSNWEPIPQHADIWLKIIKQLAQGESSLWFSYKSYLLANGWMGDIIVHVTLSSIAAMLIASLICWKYLYVTGGKTLDRIVAGPVNLEGRHALKHAKYQLKQEVSNGATPSLYLHPKVQISHNSCIGNTLITGRPGTGKTVVITHVLQQIVKQKIKTFVFDEKHEYTEMFYRKESSLLIAPWDERSQVWNISKDLEHISAPARFAEHIIHDTKDKIWSESSRLILTGIITYLKAQGPSWGWSEIYSTLNLDDHKLREILEAFYPKAVRFVEENNRTTQSIMITLQSELAWLEWLAKAWPKSHEGNFSIQRWVHKENATPLLIVQADKNFSVVGKPLCHALMSLMVDEFLARGKSQECYLVLDELANLPKSASLLHWLELARASGGRTIAGTQAISQLKSLYGGDSTDTLTSMFNNLITFKVGSSGDTANYVSKALGEMIIERPQYTNQSVSWQRITMRTVYPSDITQLPNPTNKGVTGFLTVNGWNATYRIVWPYVDIQSKSKGKISAKWTQQYEQGVQNKIKHSNTPNRILARRGEQSC